MAGYVPVVQGGEAGLVCLQQSPRTTFSQVGRRLLTFADIFFKLH